MPENILLFDGECRLCHRFVNFVLDADPRGRISFAALQSKVGQSLVPASDADTVRLWQNGRIYDRSSAALRVMWILGGAYRLITVFWIIPKPLRDLAYDFLARRRFRWWGKFDQCRLPDRATQARFLDWSESPTVFAPNGPSRQ